MHSILHIKAINAAAQQQNKEMSLHSLTTENGKPNCREGETIIMDHSRAFQCSSIAAKFSRPEMSLSSLNAENGEP